MALDIVILFLCRSQRNVTVKLTCDDFRGIAISPVLSKVFEHCLLDRYGLFLGDRL